MNENKESFSYRYSAAEQQEAEAIRNKYTQNKSPAETDKIEQLRLLDASVTNKATVWGLCVGIIFTLIMGLGMSLIMTDLGIKIGYTASVVLGLGLGFIGMAGVIFAYPIYRYVLKKEREKATPEILRLTKEITE